MINKRFLLEGYAFIIGTIIFLYAVDYVINNLDVTPITLRGFFALEWILFYGYTIYDHLKKINKDGTI